MSEKVDGCDFTTEEVDNASNRVLINLIDTYGLTPHDAQGDVSFLLAIIVGCLYKISVSHIRPDQYKEFIESIADSILKCLPPSK